MKCAKCVEKGLKSTIYAPMGGFSTCMAFLPYYDEEGVYHYHDGNANGESWSCSNGHSWHRSYQSKCPAKGCDWNNQAKDVIIWSGTP